MIYKKLTKDRLSCKRYEDPSSDMIAVLFDLEGTLVRSIEDDKIASHDFKRRTKNKLMELGIPKCELRGLRTSSLMLNHAQDVVENCFDEERTEKFQVEMEKFLKRYELRWSDVSQIFPDTVPALQKLKMYRFEMGVVTNTSTEAADRMLVKHKIRSFFRVLITRDEVRKLKPEPEGIKLALKRLKAKSFLLVGDSAHDAEAAEKAGGTSIIINRCLSKKLKFNPNCVVRSLLEIPELVLDFKNSLAQGIEHKPCV